MRYSLFGDTVLAVGVPLVEHERDLLRDRVARELQNTLNSIGWALIGATALTTLLGALLGVWASRRAVRPLADAAKAAKAIAGGHLDTRLDVTDDRDLALLTTSFNEMVAALAEPHRARRPLRVRREPRAALAVDDVVRVDRGAAHPARRDARAGPAPPSTCSSPTSLASRVWSRTCSRSPASMPARRGSTSKRSWSPSSSPTPWPSSSSPSHPVQVADADEDMVVRADKRRMVRVLANLLENARVHGGGARGVRSSPCRGNGRGAEPSRSWSRTAGRACRPRSARSSSSGFARGSGSGRRGMGDGVGLGLALVDEHVRLHGGRVWVDDRADGAQRAPAS